MKNQKICNFHVSDFHLLTVLLPYINEKIKEEKEIITISQKDLTGEVKKFLKSVKSFECEKEKIMSISWKRGRRVELEDNSNKVIFVIGTKEFIEEVSKEIGNKAYEVVNCYNINNGTEINEIIKEYSVVLTTEGKKEIYTKNSQNAQKRKTIKSQL